MAEAKTDAVVTITDQNFDQQVMQSELPVVVDCWAAWCGPCRVLTPIIEELATDYQGKIKVGALDVDANINIAQTFNIMSIPTVLYVKDGKVVDTTVGALPKPILKEHFEKLLS